MTAGGACVRGTKARTNYILRLRRVGEEIMGRIAHIQLECPHCGKYTDAYIEESPVVRLTVKCERCKGAFEFGPGTAYSPISYVPSIPQGAELATPVRKRWAFWK